MPRFQPFPALRYAPGADLATATAPPYDVLTPADVAALRDADAHNITWVDVPQHGDGDDPYRAAAQRWAAWHDEAVIVADSQPSFTLHRMAFVDGTGRERNTVGVLGGLEVVDEGAGGVLPHERTTPKARSDRLELTVATGCNMSAVWGLSLAAGLSGLLAEPGEPMGAFDADGVNHHVERVDDPTRVEGIAAAIAGSPVVIADGHHRYAVARTYREMRGDHGGDGAELTLAYVAELVEEQLSIAAIHRLYHDISLDGLRAALEPFFEAEPAGAVEPGVLAEMDRRGALCLVAPDGTGDLLVPRPERFGGVRDIDGVRLEVALQGVHHDVTYQHGVNDVVAAVTHGWAEAAVLLRPVGIDEIRRTADEGVLMPPKSTFFTPKLRTGLVVRRAS